MDLFDCIYGWVSGPLVWITFIVFIGGSLLRLYQMIALVNKKEKFIYNFISLKYSLRSIMHWIIPFAATNWRKKPILTVVTFTFHFCLLLLPLFLTGHMVLWQEAWNISIPTIPEGLADVMTLLVIGGCIFFLIRRLTAREVRYLTAMSDYVLLAVVAAPFITGFFAFHYYFNYRVILILHMLSGEIMLMLIPFTRLSHMFFSIFTRAYIGSEFGKVRHARDW